jgi:hypothetical protein
VNAQQANEIIGLLQGIFIVLGIGFIAVTGLLAYLAGKASRR